MLLLQLVYSGLDEVGVIRGQLLATDGVGLLFVSAAAAASERIHLLPMHYHTSDCDCEDAFDGGKS